MEKIEGGGLFFVCGFIFFFCLISFFVFVVLFKLFFSFLVSAVSLSSAVFLTFFFV